MLTTDLNLVMFITDLNLVTKPQLTSNSSGTEILSLLLWPGRRAGGGAE